MASARVCPCSFEPWRQTPAPAAGPPGHAAKPPAAGPSHTDPVAHHAPTRDLYELPDEEFARQLAAHPRCPKALQAKPEAIMVGRRGGPKDGHRKGSWAWGKVADRESSSQETGHSLHVKSTG